MKILNQTMGFIVPHFYVCPDCDIIRIHNERVLCDSDTIGASFDSNDFVLGDKPEQSEW